MRGRRAQRRKNTGIRPRQDVERSAEDCGKGRRSEAIKKAVDDAAAVGGGLWLSYLFVLFYLAVAAGAVTHADLFLRIRSSCRSSTSNCRCSPSSSSRRSCSSSSTPIRSCISCADRQGEALPSGVHDQRARTRPFEGSVGERKAKREGLRRQLPSNIFIQFLAGPSDLKGEGGVRLAVHAIAWITLVIRPVLLLLMMQIQFLPYHTYLVVWAQRVVLGADLVLIWWLWRGDLRRGRETVSGDHGQASPAWTHYRSRF